MSKSLLYGYPLPMVLHFDHPVIDIADDDAFMRFSTQNEPLRFERDARGSLVVYIPCGGITGLQRSNFSFQIYRWNKEEEKGIAFGPNTGFRLPNSAVRAPTISWITKERWMHLSEEQREGFGPTPDFVGELRSPSDTLAYLQEKMVEYVESGARIGVLIDPESRMVFVYRPNRPIDHFENPSVIRLSPEMPGLELDMEEIWDKENLQDSSMPLFETVSTTAHYRERCEDRVRIYDSDDRTVIVVADGAGGTGSGGFAAESVVCELASLMQGKESPADWEDALRQLDLRVSSGESTAVVVDIRRDRILGASVGDSQAWMIVNGEIIDLTARQNRKPLLGSQGAEPVGFEQGPLRGLLLVSTDGFCNYVKRNLLVRAIADWDFFTIPRKCVEMVRLPTGELWADVGIVACRSKPIVRARKRYEI